MGSQVAEDEREAVVRVFVPQEREAVLEVVECGPVGKAELLVGLVARVQKVHVEAGCRIAADADGHVSSVRVMEDACDEGEHVSGRVAERVRASCYRVG